MHNMLVRLYDLADSAAPYHTTAQAGITVRRAEPWERSPFRAFIEDEFTERWADEAETAFSRLPISAYVAVRDGDIVGLAAYECTRRNYIWPTGVREKLRGQGIDAALLLRCLEALWQLGYGYAVIGGVEHIEFYEKVCSAFVIPGSEHGICGPPAQSD